MPRAEEAEARANTSGRARCCARLLTLRRTHVETASVYSYLLRLCLDHDVFYSGERVPDDDWKAVGGYVPAGRDGLDSGIIRALPEQDVPHQAERFEGR